MRYALLMLGLLMGLASSWAQSPGAVLLRSGAQTFPGNLASFIAAPPAADEQVQGRYYRYVQFETTPNRALQARIAGSGLRLLGYVPKYTYLVSFPSTFDRSLLRSFGVYSVMPIEGMSKVAPVLQAGDFPDYALNDGNTIDLTLSVYEDLNKDAVVASLQAEGISLLANHAGSPTLDIRVAIDDIWAMAQLPFVHWVEVISDPGSPEDDFGRSLSRANVIHSALPSGRQYDGSGINVMVRDDGEVGPHIDFAGRLTQFADPPLFGDHGDMVAGVMAGGGNLDPRSRGTAPGSWVYVLDYQSTFTDQTLPLHISDSVMITNSSYSNGCNVGYTTTTQRVDQQGHDYPSLLHVFSGGNSNNQNCGYGAGTQWGNITGGHKQGKNVVAVANLNTRGDLENSSSRGPAHDGRIKPDIAANGQGQISADPFNTYGTAGGTSAAAPTAAGSFAQLYQAYRSMNGGAYPPSALIKALVLNSAEDYGNPGPDFQYGWGRVNAYRALLMMEQNQYFANTLGQGDSLTHSLDIPAGVTEMRVMVYWNDPEGAPNAARALVNDLDIQLASPAGAITLPLVLDHTPVPALLDAPAVPGVDSLNNMEQVRLANPAAGTYTLNVLGKDIPFGTQEYFVVYEFYTEEITVTYPMGGEPIVPGELLRIHWDAQPITGTFNIEFTADSGATWSQLGTAAGDERLFDWTVPDTLTGQAMIRVSRGAEADQSDAPFTIMRVPNNMEVVSVCSTRAQLAWDVVPGAIGYQVYMLGERYMDSVTVATSNIACIPIADPNVELWFAVSAIPPQGRVGQRSLAILHDAGIQDCSDEDLQPFTLLSPNKPTFSYCFDDSIQIRFSITNPGVVDQTGFDYGYRVDNDAAVIQTYGDTLLGCTLDEVGFALAVNSLGVGEHVLKVFTGLTTDENPGNDTLVTVIRITGLPFAENFELFPLCGTDANCEDEICPTLNGWVNASNGLEDDIDWRTDQGGTPSSGTGPDVDHTIGNGIGQYMYLEGSGGCTNQEALLISPCINLENVLQPELTFWYHMQGNDIGSLHVDISDGTGWTLDVMPALVGQQGGAWLQATVDLSAYLDMNIQVRLRGYTGGSWQGDIAIDDIQVYDAQAPLTPDFIVRQDTICPLQTTQLLDISAPTPQIYSWSFVPNDVVFLNGTNAGSPFPVVQFPTLGTYDVTLTTSLNGSTGTTTRTSYVVVEPGRALPNLEDFEQQVPCSTDGDCEETSCELAFGSLWNNVPNGAGDFIDWRVNFGATPSNGTGPAVDHTTGSTSGQYIYLESTQCFNAIGVLESDCIDLDSYPNATLSFWYHMWGGDITGLFVDIVGENGIDFNVGPTLIGNQGPLWQEATIDLSSYNGQTIQIRFRGISGSDFEGDIALDDIEISFVAPPEANFGASASTLCTGDSLVFNDNSTGDDLFYFWSFGPDAFPSAADSSGPHTVSYSTPGSKQVRLVISNSVGADTFFQTIVVDTLPTAGFVATPLSPDTIAFANTSSTNGTSFFWDFGDGTTSTDTSATHIYADDGDYTVSLIATNACGVDTFTQSLTVNTVSISKRLWGLRLGVSPNPNTGQFQVQVEGAKQGEIQLSLLDLRGRSVHQQAFVFAGGIQSETVQVEDLPEGMYLLRIRMENQSVTRRVVVQ